MSYAKAKNHMEQSKKYAEKAKQHAEKAYDFMNQVNKKPRKKRAKHFK